MLELKWSAEGERMQSSRIRELLKMAHIPGMISLAPGLPGRLPKEMVLETLKVLFAMPDSDQLLQYGVTEGDPAFVSEYARYFSEREGLSIDPADVMPTMGAQQSLSLLAQILIHQGKTPVVVGNPTYVGALKAFGIYDPVYIGIDLDDQGMDVDQLERELREKGIRNGIIYVVPDFQNPAGVTMSLERREQLLRVAREFDMFIIEDSPYRRLRFEGEAVPTLYSLDEGNGSVAFIFSFSKELTPWRLGGTIGRSDLIDKMVLAQQSRILNVPVLIQRTAAYILSKGWMDAWIDGSIGFYRPRRDTMLSALAQNFDNIEGVSWTRPKGGLFLWLRLPETTASGSVVNTDELITTAISSEHLVAFVPGPSFHYNELDGLNAMRLNFSYPTEDQIEEGIRRLADLVSPYLDQ